MTVESAAAILRAGGVVAFPTETVYGLGANALDESAVRKIYELKGRPASSPLIVHVSSMEMARSLSAAWPSKAEELAQRYWPGPLTLVVPKAATIPDIVTAGLPTVGIRMPRHPLALALIAAAEAPLAAPSANRFTEVSPTRAEHVRAAFGDAVPVLDGGPCEIGIESTVVSVDAAGSVKLLRPGMIVLDEAILLATPQGEAHPSPGMHAKHYSPRGARVVVVGPGEAPPADAVYLWYRVPARGVSVQMPADPDAYAARLYAVLHEVEGTALIAIEDPPATAEWEAVRDRVLRAAGSLR